MNGYIAVTDEDWWRHLLLSSTSPRDVNFWRPSSRPFVRLPEGTPFFFKLKKPHYAIAGFGYFVAFTVLPDWLAWDTFGDGNGVASLDALRQRLRTIRTGARIEEDPEGRIGCCLVADAVFFPKPMWIPQPADWNVHQQKGLKVDLTQGEGRRVHQACLERVRDRPLATGSHDAPRYGAPTLIRPRIGQAIFRVQVLDAYDRACAVTGEHALPVLDAAHIRPFASGGENVVGNGLALRIDIHRLFDRGYVTFDEQRRLVVSRRLETEFDNGKTYYAMEGRTLRAPDRGGLPDVALAWHREHAFVG